jgi:hypothetical protein
MKRMKQMKPISAVRGKKIALEELPDPLTSVLYTPP